MFASAGAVAAAGEGTESSCKETGAAVTVTKVPTGMGFSLMEGVTSIIVAGKDCIAVILPDSGERYLSSALFEGIFDATGQVPA